MPRQIRKSARGGRQNPYNLRTQRAPIRNNVAFTSLLFDEPSFINLNQLGQRRRRRRRSPLRSRRNHPTLAQQNDISEQEEICCLSNEDEPIFNLNQHGHKRRRRSSRRRRRSRSRSRRNSRPRLAQENNISERRREQEQIVPESYCRSNEDDKPSNSLQTAVSKSERSSHRNRRMYMDENLKAVTLHKNPNFEADNCSNDKISNKNESSTANKNKHSEGAIENSKDQTRSKSMTTSNKNKSSETAITNSEPNTSTQNKIVNPDLKFGTKSKSSDNASDSSMSTPDHNLDATTTDTFIGLQTPEASAASHLSKSKIPEPKHEELAPPHVDGNVTTIIFSLTD